MTRKLPFAFALAAGAAMLLPAASFAAHPAAPAWNLHSLGTGDADPCVGSFSLGSCERGGGLAMEGGDGIIVYVDGGTTIYRTTTNGGTTWSGASDLRSGQDTHVPSLAALGSDVSVAYHHQGNNQIQFIHTFDNGSSWSTPKGFAPPRQLVTDTAIAIGERTAVAVSGYDEITQHALNAAVRVRVYPVSGTPKTTTFGFAGTGCQFGTDPSLAETGNGTLVLAYWQTCSKLVARRSTDGGAHWSSPKTLSTGTHELGTAMTAHGKVVVIAYTAGGKTLVRRSGDNGSSWSAPAQAGSGATSLRISYDGGRFNLLSGGTVNVVYRSSTNGTTWSAPNNVDSEADNRTYAIGVDHDGAPVAAWVMRGTDKVYDLWEATYE